MSTPVIEVSSLSKKYRIQERQHYYTLRDTLTGFFTNPYKAVRSRLEQGEFWALEDLSFTVEEGEILGLIGNNGAGKSTLLKVLSRITPPTVGKATFHGRLGSLLEVGTGFHPELSGRENIFLNGAILGMKRSEVKQHFDEIVEFAGVSQFLDTPMKHYSSGMYTRLAFSVAAHLTAEILLVDEVLAVGDVEFQKKCLGKMGEIAKTGRTIIFVSHNLGALQQLCSRAIVLDHGKITYDGPTERAIRVYLKHAETENKLPLSVRKRPEGVKLSSLITQAELLDQNRKPTHIVSSEHGFFFRLHIKAKEKTKTGVSITLRDENQRPVLMLSSGHEQNLLFDFTKGVHVVECRVDPPHIASGRYSIECALTAPNRELIDLVPEAMFCTVAAYDPYKAGFDFSQRFAAVHVDHAWKVRNG